MGAPCRTQSAFPTAGTKAEQQEPLPAAWALGALPFLSPKGRAANAHRAQGQPVHPFTCKESTGTANGMWVAAAEPGIKPELLWLNLPECENVVSIVWGKGFNTQ